MRDEMKKVPRLRFRGYSEDWEQCKLGDIAKMYQPPTISGSELLDTGYPVFGANGYIGFYSKSNHLEDQVTISARGEGTGTPSYVKAPVWITGNSMVINVEDFDINKKFLYAMLLSYSLKKYITGGAQPQLTRDVLLKVPIIIPSYNEQFKIGTFFKQLDDTIALHQRKLEQLKELKKAYLQLMFPTKEERVPKLRFADFEGEWELCKLIGILDIIKGTQKSKSELSTNQNNCTPYPVYNGGINPSGYTNIYNRENAITISEGGNSAGFVNFVQEKFFSGGHNYTIVNNVTDTLFLFFYLCSIQEEIMRLRVGTGLPNIQKPTLMNLEIQKTTDNEQKFIGLFLKNIDILITLTQNKLNQLKSLKKSYLQNMFI